MNVLLRLTGLSLLAIVASAASLEQARESYFHSDFLSAISALKGASDAPSLLLLGQSYCGLSNFKQASETLERAVAIDPTNSDVHLWLGRSYGRRAENAFPTSALRLAEKAHDHLEKAVALNPRNWEAVDDLFQYYLQAPGFLGGGLDKALKLTAQIAKHDPAEAAADRGRVAEQKKDYTTAEAEFRRAAQLAPHQPQRLVELSRIQAKRKASGS